MTDRDSAGNHLIAARIAAARKGAGFSQSRAAKSLGLLTSAFGEIETGQRSVSFEDVGKLADTFGVSANWLLGRTDDMHAVDDPALQATARELRKLRPEDLRRLLRLLAQPQAASQDGRSWIARPLRLPAWAVVLVLVVLVGGAIAWQSFAPSTANFTQTANVPAGQALPANQGAAQSASAAQNAQGSGSQAAQWTSQGMHGQWTMRCRDGATLATLKAKCAGVLSVIDPKQHRPILIWMVGINAKEQLVSDLITPSGVLVSQGLLLQLGSNSARRIGYATCEPTGCIASAVMDDAFLLAAAAVETANITMYSPTGKPFSFRIPISGIDDVQRDLKS